MLVRVRRVTYASIIGLVLCAPTQLYLLNTALATGKASYTVPVYTVNNIANGVLVSGLLFHDFDTLPAGRLHGFLGCFGAVLAAVAALSSLQGRKAGKALAEANKLAALDTFGDPPNLSYRLDYLSLRVGGVSPLALQPAAHTWNDEPIVTRRRVFSVLEPRMTAPPLVPARSSSMSNLPGLLEQLNDSASSSTHDLRSQRTTACSEHLGADDAVGGAAGGQQPAAGVGRAPM